MLPVLEYPSDRDIPKQVKTVREWIENPKGKDLFTKIRSVEGLSYPVIVCFQEDIPERFERNVFMRAKAILIVVNIKSKSFDYIFALVGPVHVAMDVQKKFGISVTKLIIVVKNVLYHTGKYTNPNAKEAKINYLT